jgi:FtsZ-binding cell division protein ZapB
MALIDQDPEVDTLAHIEDRIRKAVELVTRLRQEKDAALKELAETQAAWEEAQSTNQKMIEELEGLQTERKQVRNRLERLLGHIDQLGTT